MRRVLILTLLASSFAPGIFADIPHTLNYQGQLMDQSGQPVTDGQYTVTFRLYTAASGGNMVWEEQQNVATQNGYFNTVLGNTTALTAYSDRIFHPFQNLVSTDSENNFPRKPELVSTDSGVSFHL